MNIIDNINLVDKFIETAQTACATTELINNSSEELFEVITKATRGKTKINIARSSTNVNYIYDAVLEMGNYNSTPSDKELAISEIGITEAFAGVARTGSICISIDNGIGAAISLFPRIHIAVLETKNIVLRPRDVFDRFILNQSGDIKNFIFVTGPSATADMGSLVRGVHAPGKLHIILIK